MEWISTGLGVDIPPRGQDRNQEKVSLDQNRRVGAEFRKQARWDWALDGFHLLTLLFVNRLVFKYLLQ